MNNNKLELKKESTLELKCIRELLGMNFFIPDYQRGYRWTDNEVKDLLEDINAFALKPGKRYGEFYCLQPLVVRQMTDKEKEANQLEQGKVWYEVIDGQQRLTTIHLMLSYLQDVIKVLKHPQDKYAIEYQRNPANGQKVSVYLNNIRTITAADASSIDCFHMSNAYLTISDQIEKRQEEINLSDFCNALLKCQQRTTAIDNGDSLTVDDANNVRFIWYEISDNEDPIKVFTRLNIGKISLTNAELIKALLLNRSNFGGNDNIKLRQQEIAAEWDRMEYTFQNDEFWLFLHDAGYDRPTRIDVIFDMIVEKNRLKLNKSQMEKIGNDDQRTFRYFYEYFYDSASKYSKEERLEECWKLVKDHFEVLKEWYDDLVFYHYIGFAIETKMKKAKLQDLLDDWFAATDKTNFLKSLKKKIADRIREVPRQFKEDGSDKRKARPLLLFHNIQTIINQNEMELANKDYQLGTFYKFPFHLYKKEKWDVEHINSNTPNSEDDETTRSEWLLNVYIAADEEVKEAIKTYFSGKISDAEKEQIFAKVKDRFKEPEEWSLEEKNRIWNYTLLDSSTNRSYGNSIFSGKRRVIIGKEQGINYPLPEIKDGKLTEKERRKAKSAFVPVCTKNVFGKYYSSAYTAPNYWTKEDAKEYLNDIKECINKLS